jgi:glycosyltransferase involved in cell wall biosynthesis
VSGPAHLALFVPNLKGGGTERVAAALAAGFAARGHRVDLLLARAEGTYLDQLPATVRIVDFDKDGVFACLLPLARYLRRERPAALLAALGHVNVTALLANRLAGSPSRIVVSERSSIVETTRHHRALRDYVVRFLRRWTYRWADAIVVVASAMVAEMRALPGLAQSRIEMIPNPIVSPAIDEAARAEPDCAAFAAGVPVILGAGRLAHEKDFETLLRGFALLRATRDARLVIIGEGADRPALERLAAELGIAGDLSLPGFVTNPFAYMRAAALFVLSSRFEGMPGVLVQAMACGTPVVATDCRTGPAEILEDGRWGALVPVGDPAALALAMAAALDSEDRPDVRERAADFDEAKSVERYLGVLLPDRN